jgi:hypothetical protein
VGLLWINLSALLMSKRQNIFIVLRCNTLLIYPHTSKIYYEHFEKPLPGHSESLGGPKMARGPRVGHPWSNLLKQVQDVKNIIRDKNRF